jgi:hypothetical protein
MWVSVRAQKLVCGYVCGCVQKLPHINNFRICTEKLLKQKLCKTLKTALIKNNL